MLRRVVLVGLAVLAVAFAAWRVEAGDGKPTVDDRVAALESKIALLEAKVAILEARLAPPVAAPDPDASRKATEAPRAVKVTLDLKEMPLRSAVQAIAETTKIDVVVAPDVGDDPITVAVRDASLTDVLTMLGTAAHFEWTVTGYNLVRITGATAK